ncbi:DUF2809 domain-containing protein [Sphingomonas sp. DG1-23]|uniref:ribosomal maturation YjgA family protein n=1 Tax=Sphingomonas sp. DG1-23 TaxID=3068316 RepID=UPI00273D46CE|nr:DUF2809 domain-containing protein [Sphingomonas sp. DG1-23]MDP5278365.1 DUF2809 domain-containing protein [Sphingomonas sp. DG1-23]
MRFHPGYALVALALLLIEIAIALFVRDRFVRPYLGDVIAVILVYAALRATFRLDVIPAAATAFLVAAAIEFGQLFRVLDLLGLADHRIARTVLGYGFELKDFVAYATGGLIVLAVERWRAGR